MLFDRFGQQRDLPKTYLGVGDSRRGKVLLIDRVHINGSGFGIAILAPRDRRLSGLERIDAAEADDLIPQDGTGRLHFPPRRAAL